MKIFVLFLTLFFISSHTSAHPVSYKGAVSLMSSNEAQMNDLLLHYSFSHRFSIGARAIRLEQNNLNSRLLLSQLSLLLKRWNGADFQANIYAFGGLGVQNYDHKNGLASLAGTKLDIESRKYFLSGTYEGLLENLTRDFHRMSFRAGIAPYIASYDQLNSWLMLEYQYKPGHNTEHDFIPLLRFFYKNVLWELGSSIRGDWIFDFMVHF